MTGLSRLRLARHARVFALAALGALALHAFVLDPWAAVMPVAAAARPPALQVRTVEADAPVPERAARADVDTTAAVPPLEVSRPPPVARTAGRPAPAARPRVTGVALVAVSSGPGTGPAAAPDVELAPALAPRAASPAAAASEVSADDDAPVYRTRLPTPVTLHYELQRGLLSGVGELAWRPAGSHYTLRLDGHVAGLAVLTQTSEGGFDAAGIAPLRFTDQRLRSAARAANILRDRGKIVFSGPSVEFPLPPGLQDRLSWMIQLAAVLAAEPERGAAGGRVALPVVGARGDLGVWAFRFVADERVATAAGEVQAQHFTREARSPHDTEVDVWLDPARQHLPVRASLRNAGEGDALELLLRSIETPP